MIAKSIPWGNISRNSSFPLFPYYTVINVKINTFNGSDFCEKKVLEWQKRKADTNSLQVNGKVGGFGQILPILS